MHIVRKPRLRCVYCKRAGHVIDRCFRYLMRHEQHDVVVSQFDQMRLPLDSLFALFSSRAVLPRAHITVAGHTELAVFRTGLPYNVASRSLYDHLCRCCVIFSATQLIYETGTTQRMRRAVSRIPIELMGRRIEVNLFAHPTESATTAPTMLGVEFLEQAGIVIDMAERCWSFAGNRRRKWYPFVRPHPGKPIHVLWYFFQLQIFR